MKNKKLWKDKIEKGLIPKFDFVENVIYNGCFLKEGMLK